MKHKENAGKHQTGKAGTSRRRHRLRLSAINGLALFLSAGISEQVSALTFTFEYTYTITANTCQVSVLNGEAEMAYGQIATGTQTVNTTDINWETVTKAQLTDENQALKKTFGLVMNCNGDIYVPKLTVSGDGYTQRVSSGDTFYVTDNASSIAGFAVKAAEVSEATEADKTQDALQGNNPILSETVRTKKMLLTAWPTIMPNKDYKGLISGTDIIGTVTIKVSYN